MKKTILNLGSILNKVAQKDITGGRIPDLSRVCGYITFSSVESQCLSLAYGYQPRWFPNNNTCSALGSGSNCDELELLH